MPSLPSGVAAYRRTPTLTETSAPQSLLQTHSTKAGVWGRIVVLSGRLRYEQMNGGEAIELGPDDVAIIAPEAPHRVQPLGEVSFYVEFLR